MDPLSITASTLAILHTVGVVAKSLDSLVRSVRNVDSRITGLCDELGKTSTTLEAIHATVKKGQTLDFGQDDDALWRQSELALNNCQTTLNELSLIVGTIKGNCQERTFGWKLRAVYDFNSYSEEIEMAKDKLHKSNYALQTVLQTINVSLSLKNNESQHVILRELEKLRTSISEALHASSRPIGGFRGTEKASTDSRITRNLRHLAEAAKQYHTTASSCAGTTVRSDGSEVPWQSYPGADMSLFGDFPVSRRERVEQFILDTSETDIGVPPSPSASRRQSSYVPSRLQSNVADIRRPNRPSVTPGPDLQENDDSEVEEDDEEDDDVELDLAFLEGLRELATASIKTLDYDKAIKFLQEAMAHKATKEGGVEHRQMRIQLALCYFLQGKWRLAEPVVVALAKVKAHQDLVVCNLLHALSLGYLSEYSFDEARDTCKQALLWKRKLCKNDRAEWKDYHETFALFVTIFNTTGDFIRAEVFRRQLPEDYVYSHPANERVFIESHVDLLEAVLGDDVPDFLLRSTQPAVAELDCDDVEHVRGQRMGKADVIPVRHGSALRKKLSEYEKYELDTAKEVVSFSLQSPSPSEDADDEKSMSSPRQSPLRRRFTRFFASRRTKRVTTAQMPESPQSDSSSMNISPTTMSRIKNNMNLKLKRPKTLLRKRPTKRKVEMVSTFKAVESSPEGGSFKLLRMYYSGGQLYPKADGLSRQFSWRAGREDLEHSPEKFVSTLPPVAELDDTSAGSVKLLQGMFQESHNETAKSQTSTPDAPSSPKTSGYNRQADGAVLAADEALVSLNTISRENDSGGEVDSSRVSIDSEASIRDAGEGIGRQPANSLQPYFATFNVKDWPKQAQPPATLQPCRFNAVADREIDWLLDGLSSTMASLRGAQDADELQAKASTLRSLLPRLRVVSNDQLLVYDTEGVLRRLELRIAATKEKVTDSGYESGGAGESARESEESAEESARECARESAELSDAESDAESIEGTPGDSAKEQSEVSAPSSLRSSPGQYPGSWSKPWKATSADKMKDRMSDEMRNLRRCLQKGEKRGPDLFVRIGGSDPPLFF